MGNSTERDNLMTPVQMFYDFVIEPTELKAATLLKEVLAFRDKTAEKDPNVPSHESGLTAFGLTQSVLDNVLNGKTDAISEDVQCQIAGGFAVMYLVGPPKSEEELYKLCKDAEVSRRYLNKITDSIIGIMSEMVKKLSNYTDLNEILK